MPVRRPRGYYGEDHTTLGSDILSVLKILKLPEQVLGKEEADRLREIHADQWYPIEVLLGLMAKATSIEDSIRVQQHLQDVQLTIEELKGQLHVLSDQSDLSTISVSMSVAALSTSMMCLVGQRPVASASTLAIRPPSHWCRSVGISTVGAASLCTDAEWP